MKEIVLEIREEKYRFFIELIKSLDFVSVKTQSKKELLLNVARGMQEAALAGKGKIKSRPAKSFLNEL
jgi:hypothetical protein